MNTIMNIQFYTLKNLGQIWINPNVGLIVGQECIQCVDLKSN